MNERVIYSALSVNTAEFFAFDGLGDIFVSDPTKASDDKVYEKSSGQTLYLEGDDIDLYTTDGNNVLSEPFTNNQPNHIPQYSLISKSTSSSNLAIREHYAPNPFDYTWKAEYSQYNAKWDQSRYCSSMQHPQVYLYVRWIQYLSLIHI